MRKTEMKRVVLGVFAGMALLAGCVDGGRSAAMTPQEDYYPSEPTWPLQRGSNTGLTWELPKAGSAAGGAGNEGVSSALPIHESKAWKDALWLRQDFRVPYAPAPIAGLVAVELGTGKPLRAENGAWVQGLYTVEVGSGIAPMTAPESAPYQPQPPPAGSILPPQLPLERP